jgi:hypothetical protein
MSLAMGKEIETCDQRQDYSSNTIIAWKLDAGATGTRLD